MTRFLRRAAAALALSMGFFAPAHAANTSPDFTDLWFNANEPGWGFNVIQQGSTLFGTLFVYGADNSARWYVADNLALQEGTPGTYRFTSKFYRASGPFFGAGSFNPSNVSVTEVGEASITFSSPTSATLVYNVGTDTVTKQMTRQTFRVNNITGGFFGGWSAVASACSNSSNNGPAALVGNITATIAGNSATFRIDAGSNFICTFTGTYSQQGRLGTVSNGTWQCLNNGAATINGTFTLTEVDVQVNGLTASFAAQDNLCTYTGGHFGGFRVVGG